MGMAGFVGHTRFFEELEEALVAVALLLRSRRTSNATGPRPVYDLCCGKGFAGMLVAGMAFGYGNVCRICSEIS